MTDQYHLKLYASLAVHLPQGAVENRISLPLPQQSIGEIIHGYGITPEEAHLVLVNGVYIDFDARHQTYLKNGDTLAIWPPVAGG